MSKNLFRNEPKSKIEASVIALILLLSIAGMLMAGSVVNAATANIATHAFIVIAPDPIGVGQSVGISMYLIEINPLVLANQPTGNYSSLQYRWQNYTLTIIKPDGTTENQGPYQASDVSSVYVPYTPNQVGTYTFTFKFPGQLEQGTGPQSGKLINAFYGASTDTTTLTVQQTPITAMPQTPLPTNYWQRPINWQNQLWYTISGNWFGINQWSSLSTYNPDTIAPQSAHILWTKPIAFGGQIGGSLYSAGDLSNYYTGKSYEAYFTPVIINGVLFYNTPKGVQPVYGTNAVNLRTGQEIWYSNNTGQPTTVQSATDGKAYGIITPGINYGEVYSHHNPNEVGGLAYLWGVSGSTYSLFDANTGNWILNIANSPGGTAVMGPNGELLVYTLNAASGWLALWNSTLCVGAQAWVANGWEWRPSTGLTLQWSTGIQWNVSIPTFVSYNQYSGVNGTQSISVIRDNVVLTIASSGGSNYPQDFQMEAGYSAIDGKFLWVQNRTMLSQGETNSGLMGPAGKGVYVEFNKATKQFCGFSMSTGQQLWGPTDPLPNALAAYTYFYTVTGDNFVAMGIQALYAFNFQTGKLVWTWSSPSAGLQSPFDNYPLEQNGQMYAAGDLVFVAGGVSHGDQLYRGAQLYAINATNGQLVWSEDGFYIGAAAADGEFVAWNGYDGQIYAYGQGQSATTVSIPDSTVSQGTPVFIKGTVTDQSPGNTCLGIPAAGTPAVSDESMSKWMAYLYQQQTKPANATGVSVHLTAIDPNGNSQDIGRVTSDIDGNFALLWTPPVPGVYTVKATFEGSNSYFSSYGTTTFAVVESPSASITSSPQPTATSPQTTSSPAQTFSPSPSIAQQPTSNMPMVTYIAIAAAVVIIALIAAAVVLKRRK